MLGIPVNASAKDLAANKGKMRLLDIGNEVAFPLDLNGFLPPVVRTTETVATAERDINQPQDKVLHALFWFAKPSSPLGNLAYEHLLQGMTDSAIEKFSRCQEWEARLSLSTIFLQNGETAEALSAIAFVIDKHCDEFVTSVAGQTYKEDATSLRHRFLEALTKELDAAELYSRLSAADVSQQMLDELHSLAVEGPIATIEKEIAACKAVDASNPTAQLNAGKKLAKNTQKVMAQLQKLVGNDNPRYSRLVDKLANQILQCSINYFNNIDGENREVIENALKLGEYALKIAVGKMARDHIQHNVDILRKKKENLPPAEVEKEVNAIMNALAKFVDLPDKIEHSLSLLNNTRPYLLTIKTKLGSTNSFYLKLSTQVVANALHNLIEEVNNVQKEPQHNFSTSSPAMRSTYDDLESFSQKLIRLMIIEKTVDAAWDCTKIMDTFDMESSFRNERYLPNRNTLKSMYDQFAKATTQIPPVNHVSPYIGSSSTSGSSSNSDTNWGCIVWGIIGFIIFIIIMANQ